MKIVKYSCPACHNIVEIPSSPVARIITCDECKKKFLAAQDADKVRKKLSLKQKQKWCLWMGTGIMDLVGAAILYDRVVYDTYTDIRLKWSALDAFFLITLIIITTAVFFYTLSLTDYKPKDKRKQ